MFWFGSAKPGSGGGAGDTGLFVVMEWSQSDSNWGNKWRVRARAANTLIDPNKEHLPCTFEGASSEAKPFVMINTSFIDTPKIHVSELKTYFGSFSVCFQPDFYSLINWAQ
jgi:hypothetical protein